ncbi:MAG: hypothetical protein KJO20_01980 [Eudoraea sp.]|nr:hypothetical protein [Eudoraea sp.]MBT8320861.1 hypothetical protein [Eudoraea sp.]
MGAAKKTKNTVQGTEIDAGGDVTIGDRKVINVYGMETNQGDIEFVIKFFVFLMGLFAVSSIVFLVINPQNTIASFAAGGFFVLLALLIVVLLRSKSQSSVNIK